MQEHKEPPFNKSIKIGSGYYDLFSRKHREGYVYFIHVPTKNYCEKYSKEMFSYARLFWKLFTKPDEFNSLPRKLQDIVAGTDISEWAIRLSETGVGIKLGIEGFKEFSVGRTNNRMTVHGTQPYEKKFVGVRDKVTGLVKHFWLPQRYNDKQVMNSWKKTFIAMTKLSTQRNCSIALKTALMKKSKSTVEAAEKWDPRKTGRFEIFDCGELYNDVVAKKASAAVKANNLKMLNALV